MYNAQALNLEGSLINRNNIARNIDGNFNTVENGIQAIGCSDCCSSNGDSCNPNDCYPDDCYPR